MVNRWRTFSCYISESDGRYMMVLHCRLTAKRVVAILTITCVAVFGYYVLVEQDSDDKSQNEARGNIMPAVRAPTKDVTRDISEDKASRKPFSNGSVSQMGSSRQVKIERIDTANSKSDKGISDVRTGKRTIDLNSTSPEELLNRTVIVTAISQNHLAESKGMIGSVQEFLPNTRIILYDLGLTEKGVQQVQSLCNVELRPFDARKYPPHVKDLHTYAWKPLIIQNALDEFGIIFWCDSSARFHKDPLVLFSLLKEQNGFMRRIVEFKPNKMLARTHPKMFGELGIDKEQFAKDVGYAMCFEANRLLLVNSALIHESIVVPWVDCALNPDCISPKGSVLGQNQKGPVKYTHRFDQAALALIAYKNLRGVWNEGNDRTQLFHDVVGLSRSSAGASKVKFCSS